VETIDVPDAEAEPSKIVIRPDHIQITVGMTIPTGDFGSMRPEFSVGFPVPEGVNFTKFIRACDRWTRWNFHWLVLRQLKDHTGLKENISGWLASFFRRYPEAPPLRVRLKKIVKSALQKLSGAEPVAPPEEGDDD